MRWKAVQIICLTKSTHNKEEKAWQVLAGSSSVKHAKQHAFPTPFLSGFICILLLSKQVSIFNFLFYYYYASSFISWNDTLLSLKWGFMPSSVHFSVKSMAHDSGTLSWSCGNQMNSLKAWWHLWIGNSLKAQPSVLFLTTFSLWDFSVLPDETSRTHYLQNNV